MGGWDGMGQGWVVRFYRPVLWTGTDIEMGWGRLWKTWGGGVALFGVFGPCRHVVGWSEHLDLDTGPIQASGDVSTHPLLKPWPNGTPKSSQVTKLKLASACGIMGAPVSLSQREPRPSQVGRLHLRARARHQMRSAVHRLSDRLLPRTFLILLGRADHVTWILLRLHVSIPVILLLLVVVGIVRGRGRGPGGRGREEGRESVVFFVRGVSVVPVLVVVAAVGWIGVFVWHTRRFLLCLLWKYFLVKTKILSIWPKWNRVILGKNEIEWNSCDIIQLCDLGRREVWIGYTLIKTLRYFRM